MTSTDETSTSLPSYLQTSEVMELEDVPLQVALLTGELAAQRKLIAALAERIDLIAEDLEDING